MYKYEMDPTRTVEATERTRDAGRTRDGRTDGQTDGRSETNIPPQQLATLPIYPPYTCHENAMYIDNIRMVTLDLSMIYHDYIRSIHALRTVELYMC